MTIIDECTVDRPAKRSADSTLQALQSDGPRFDRGGPAGFDTIVEIGTTEGGVVIDEVVTEADGDGDWELQAACRAVDGAADLFFSEELSDIVEAKRICAECPVIAPCLEGAIARSEPCGVWGGQLFANGRILTQKRRRGRPPKVPRPEDQLPVVPVPERLQKLIA